MHNEADREINAENIIGYEVRGEVEEPVEGA